MSNVITIKFSTDLETQKLNELRHRMEIAQWKRRWREAEAEQDYCAMDRLNVDYELVGLP